MEYFVAMLSHVRVLQHLQLFSIWTISTRFGTIGCDLSRGNMFRLKSNGVLRLWGSWNLLEYPFQQQNDGLGYEKKNVYIYTYLYT